MKGLLEQCVHSLTSRGKFILPLIGIYYKIGGCPLGFFWSHEVALCFDAYPSLLGTALWCLVEPLFPRYLFHHGIVLPLIAAIVSRACVFFIISKPVTIQARNCSLVCPPAQWFLWWETSVGFFWLHQVCRLWCAILAGLLQDAVPSYACERVSVWIIHPK